MMVRARVVGLFICHLLTLGPNAFAASDAEVRHRISAPMAEFGLRLMQEQDHGEKNIVSSPFSAADALYMVLAGAAGQTENEMRSALGFPAKLLDKDWQAVEVLNRSLMNRPASDGAKVLLSNRLYAQKAYQIRDAYQSKLEKVFGIKLTSLDFVGDLAGALQRINGDVKTATAGKIPKLLDELDPHTKLVLLNAIYLKAKWKTPFDPHDTRPDTFSLANGKSIKTPMMHLTSSDFQYAENSSFQAIGLPFEGETLRLTVFLPRTNKKPHASSKKHTPPPSKGQAGGKILALLQDLQSRHIDLAMPRFKIRTHDELNTPLQNLGMRAVFQEKSADLTPMHADKNPLFIAKVIQEAFITVDEVGAEAAAATVVEEANGAGMPEPALEIKVDRPFMFTVDDVETGTLLFVGRVRDPREGSS